MTLQLQLSWPFVVLLFITLVVKSEEKNLPEFYRTMRQTTGFNTAGPTDLPGVVYIRYNSVRHLSSKKLGYVLSERWILTTAHGLQEKEFNGIVVIIDCPQPAQYRGISVERVVIPEGYKNNTHETNATYDIALLKTYRENKINRCVGLINLPTTLGYKVTNPETLRRIFFSYYNYNKTATHRVFWTQTNITYDESNATYNGRLIVEHTRETHYDGWNPAQSLMEYRQEGGQTQPVLIGLSSYHNNHCRNVTDVADPSRCNNKFRMFINVAHFVDWIKNTTAKCSL